MNDSELQTRKEMMFKIFDDLNEIAIYTMAYYLGVYKNEKVKIKILTYYLEYLEKYRADNAELTLDIIKLRCEKCNKPLKQIDIS